MNTNILMYSLFRTNTQFCNKITPTAFIIKYKHIYYHFKVNEIQKLEMQPIVYVGLDLG